MLTFNYFYLIYFYLSSVVVNVFVAINNKNDRKEDHLLRPRRTWSVVFFERLFFIHLFSGVKITFCLLIYENESVAELISVIFIADSNSANEPLLTHRSLFFLIKDLKLRLLCAHSVLVLDVSRPYGFSCCTDKAFGHNELAWVVTTVCELLRRVG